MQVYLSQFGIKLYFSEDSLDDLQVQRAVVSLLALGNVLLFSAVLSGGQELPGPQFVLLLIDQLTAGVFRPRVSTTLHNLSQLGLLSLRLLVVLDERQPLDELGNSVGGAGQTGDLAGHTDVQPQLGQQGEGLEQTRLTEQVTWYTKYMHTKAVSEMIWASSLGFLSS